MNRKFFIVLGLALLTSISFSVFYANSINIFTIGTGIIRNNNERIFTLNTPLNIIGSKGYLNIGNLSVYAPNCSAIDNVVARLNNGALVIYCPQSSLNSHNYQYGFSGSNISSFSLTYNNRNTPVKFRIGWGGLQADETIIGGGTGSYSSFDSTASNENQIRTLSSTSAFINAKSTQVSKGFECIYIFTNSDFAFDLIDLTIEYSCK